MILEAEVVVFFANAEAETTALDAITLTNPLAIFAKGHKEAFTGSGRIFILLGFRHPVVIGALVVVSYHPNRFVVDYLGNGIRVPIAPSQESGSHANLRLDLRAAGHYVIDQ